MPEENMMPMEEDMPEPPKKRKGIFGGGGKEQPAMDMSGVAEDVNNLGRRLRLVEEGAANVRNMLQITEENMIAKNKTFNSEIKALTSDVNEIRKEIHEIKEKVGLAIREIQAAAKKEDVKLLEKYINLWNPVKFVTKGELDFVVSEAVDKSIKSSKANSEKSESASYVM